MRDNENNAIVVKGNQLVQNFKYDLSKTEIRVVNMIISNIDSPLYDEKFNRMKFHVSDFYKMLGWDDIGGKDYVRLKETLRKLSSVSSDYITIGDKETIVRWIEKPYFHKRSGTVELKLDDDLKPYLLHANGYFKALLKYYAEMDSKYSMYIYELMKSWEGCRKKSFEINDFRKQINAEQKSYENFGKFHQGIIKPSVEEINRVTDLHLEYETLSSGKKVTHIVFYIRKKEELKLKKTKEEDPTKKETTREEDEMFTKQFGMVSDEFIEFTKDQIIALYYAAAPHMPIPSMELDMDESMEQRQADVIEYIAPKLAKIKATPEETKSTVFFRLLNAVQKNY